MPECDEVLLLEVGRLRRVEAAARALAVDGHVYGSRPCATCAAMTAALGWPFGCDLWRKRKADLAAEQGR